MDNLKLSHKIKLVLKNQFEKWINISKYGNHSMATATCGTVHNYLGKRSWTTAEARRIESQHAKYVKNMPNNFSVKLGKKDVAKTPAGDNLFNLGTRAKLDTKRSEIFHTFMAKGLFLCQRARPDIGQAILVLCTRVKDPNQADLGKADESDEVFKWHQEQKFDSERQGPRSGQVVCGRIICSLSRLKKLLQGKKFQRFWNNILDGY
jgi:hypothetical protein